MCTRACVCFEWESQENHFNVWNISGSYRKNVECSTRFWRLCVSQLPFALPSAAFNRIYEPEISNALLSLLASGVAFSIVVRIMSRRQGPRWSVSRVNWRNLSLRRTSLHIVTVDCRKHLSLYPSYLCLCKSAVVTHLFTRSITYSSIRSLYFIGWWTCNSSTKNVTSRLNTMLFLSFIRVLRIWFNCNTGV